MARVDVTIVDCGIGNIKSVQRMVEAADASAEIVRDPAALADARRVILPGVGAFDAGMAGLHDGGWLPVLEDARERGIPILGVCLGMQLLCRRSEEGQRPGLGWIAADVIEIDRGGDPRLKLPHMGWAVIDVKQPNPLIPTDEGEQRFYHVHRYRAVCDDPADVLCTTTYGTEFVTGVMHGNLYGLQFHPEKSHQFGMGVMRRFAQIGA